MTHDVRLNIRQEHQSLAPLATSVAGAVAATGLSRATLYRAIAEGRLVARKFRGRTVIIAADLEAFLARLPVIESRPQQDAEDSK